MVLDRPLADPQIGSNVLARMSIQNQRHDLALARGQRCQPLLESGPLLQPAAGFAAGIPAESRLARSDDSRTGFSMKSDAPAFIAATAMATSNVRS